MRVVVVCLLLVVAYVFAVWFLWKRSDHFLLSVDVMWGVSFVLSSVVACEGWVWLGMRAWPWDVVVMIGVASYCMWLVACASEWCRFAFVCGFVCAVSLVVLCRVAVGLVGWEQSFPVLWLFLHVVTWDLFFWLLFRQFYLGQIWL